ncbi:MAG: hypothetical protein LBU89_04905 [Fibromonadaceae bacterium]|jgi:hypothetical protein|nr:hypothetical protein [Fibromonadaceae bacterium]
MKNSYKLLVILIALISCTEADKYSDEGKLKIRLENSIFYLPPNYRHELRLEGKVIFDNSKESIAWPLDEARDYFHSHFWIINNDTNRSSSPLVPINYGEHLVKLVLVDFYGDTIRDSLLIQYDEPLKVELLSPIEGYSLSKTETLEFRYRISGVDSWEKAQSFTYVSTDKESLWEEENIYEPPLTEPMLTEVMYYWGVKVSTEQKTIYSEKRRLWLED